MRVPLAGTPLSVYPKPLPIAGNNKGLSPTIYRIAIFFKKNPFVTTLPQNFVIIQLQFGWERFGTRFWIARRLKNIIPLQHQIPKTPQTPLQGSIADADIGQSLHPTLTQTFGVLIRSSSKEADQTTAISGR